MPDNPTTALAKTATSPALARVSSQLALTDKLLAKPEEPFLIPYRKGSKWGFCDRDKNIVIDCVWDWVSPFKFGLAIVVLFSDNMIYKIRGQRKSSGLINTKGEIVFNLSEHYRIGIQSRNIIGLWQISTYEPGERGDDIVQETDGWGLFNYTNYRHISSTYDEMFSFNSGVYKVGCDKNFFSQKYGFVNSHGEEIIPCDYEVCNDFYGYYSTKKKEKETYSIIDIEGKQICRTNYLYMDSFHDELSIFSKNLVDSSPTKKNQYGYVDIYGDEFLKDIYKGAMPFSEGLAAVSKDGEIEDYRSESSKLRGNSDYLRGISNYGHASSGSSIGFINTSGDEVIPFNFSIVSKFKEGRAMVKRRDSSRGFIRLVAT